MSRILIDGRFVGVGDSQTRYVLELVRNILKLDKENEYTLLTRPNGIKDVESWLKIPRNEIQNANKSQIISDVIPAKAGIQVLDPRVKPEDDKGAEKFANLKVEVLDVPHYSVAEQTRLLKYLNQKKFDLVHFTQFNHPVFYRGDYVITIQDLTLVGHLHYFNFVKQLAFNSVMKSAARDSKKIIAISKVTEKDVISFFGTPKTKFALIYHGIDHERFNERVKNQSAGWRTRIKQFKSKYKIENDYILYTGMWKKHKNLKRMLLAFEKYILDCHSKLDLESRLDPRVKPEDDRERVQLVLVGKVDQGEPEVLSEIDRINNKLATYYMHHTAIVATGFIEEDELPIANAGAMAYCIPSLSEGFGWPPLEAMACGTPVISSNVSCMPEILGDAPIYFDPYKIEEIAEAMKKITSDEKLRSDLSKKGLEQAKRYNWQECAKKTLEVYRELLHDKV